MLLPIDPRMDRRPNPPLRLVLCTSGGLFGTLVLERLLGCASVRVVGIVHSTRVLKPSYGFWRGAWEQWRASGIAYTSYLWCATSLAGWLCERVRAHGSVAGMAAARGIAVLHTRDINAAPHAAFIAGLAPDLLVSAFFNQRLSLPVLAMARAAAVNIHPSLLPAYRGVDPVFFARLRHEPKTGVTVHHLASELDQGNIVMQAELTRTPGQTVFGETAQLYARGADLLAGAAAAIAAGDPGRPQPPNGHYDSWPTRRQVRQLRAHGTRLIRLADLARIGAPADRSAQPAADRVDRPIEQ
jgi:methionyl-tRNA formyltransferase